ncbi:MAG: pyruvate kinase, partial [Desulfobacterales bacterium]
MPRTKIVATIGPASAGEATLRRLIQNGMRVARLNFSHGTHKDHGRLFRRIRKLSAELDQPVAILQDLCGPKIRVGRIEEPGVRLEAGQRLVLTNREVLGSAEAISVNYPELPREVTPGDRLMLADGMLELVVVATGESDIICNVIIGGLLTSHKGINLPTGTLNTEPLTPKDIEDLAFGLKL